MLVVICKVTKIWWAKHLETESEARRWFIPMKAAQRTYSAKGDKCPVSTTIQIPLLALIES